MSAIGIFFFLIPNVPSRRINAQSWIEILDNVSPPFLNEMSSPFCFLMSCSLMNMVSNQQTDF